MKKIFFLLYVILLVSCSATITRDTVKKPLFEVLTQQSDGGANINFTRYWRNQMKIKMLQNDKNWGVKLVLLMFKIKFCNFEYGRKITGGYSITIESVVETDKKYNYKCQRECSGA
jgi:hypothetical protein